MKPQSTPTCRRHSVLASRVLLALAVSTPALAGTKIWVQGTTVLTTSANWNPSGAPATTDEVLFDGSVTPASSLTAGSGAILAWGNLIWNNNTSSTLQSNTTGASDAFIRLSGGGGSSAAGNAGGASGDLIVMGSSATAATLTFSSVNINATPGTATLRLRLDASGNFNVVNSGATLSVDTIISESGSRTLTKTGAGTLFLGKANSYTGGTVLSAGRLLVGASSALGTGGLTINGGTLASDSVLARTLANNVTVGGDFALGQGSGGQAITLNGTMDLGAAARTITLNNSATFGGTISNGGLIVSDAVGTRTLTLSGASNSYAGGTTVNSGTLRPTAAAALGVGAVTVSGTGTLDIFGTGAGNLVLGPGAAFTLSGGSVKFNLGTSFDQITGSGAAFGIAGGSFVLDVSGVGFSYGSTYALLSSFSGGSVSGLTITGYDTTNYLATLGNDGVLSFTATAVPEPSGCAVLAGFGVLGLAASRRRRAVC